MNRTTDNEVNVVVLPSDDLDDPIRCFATHTHTETHRRYLRVNPIGCDNLSCLACLFACLLGNNKGMSLSRSLLEEAALSVPTTTYDKRWAHDVGASAAGKSVWEALCGSDVPGSAFSTLVEGMGEGEAKTGLLVHRTHLMTGLVSHAMDPPIPSGRKPRSEWLAQAAALEEARNAEEEDADDKGQGGSGGGGKNEKKEKKKTSSSSPSSSSSSSNSASAAASAAVSSPGLVPAPQGIPPMVSPTPAQAVEEVGDWADGGGLVRTTSGPDLAFVDGGDSALAWGDASNVLPVPAGGGGGATGVVVANDGPLTEEDRERINTLVDMSGMDPATVEAAYLAANRDVELAASNLFS